MLEPIFTDGRWAVYLINGVLVVGPLANLRRYSTRAAAVRRARQLAADDRLLDGGDA